jgi:hypothetical protein
MQSAFTLPGGLIGPDGACYRRGSLRPLNGGDEEWIHAQPDDTSQAVVVTGLIARCVRRIGHQRVTRALVRQLFTGDRDFLLLRLYQVTFGGVISLVPICPAAGCGIKMDLDLLVSEIPIEERPVRASYRLSLDAQATEIAFRLPRGADQERLASARGASAGQLREFLLDACTLSGARPNDSSEALSDAIEHCGAGVALEVSVHCPECGHPFDVELDIAGLLLREVARRQAAFDREIHLLASHYRWSLRELLLLPVPRRQRFIRLLGDELRGQG